MFTALYNALALGVLAGGSMWRLNQSLLRFALKNRIRSSAAARGACLDATIQLALHCKRLGLDTHATALHWRVPGDPHFREHWALGVGNGLVLDMTAVQVDGNSRPLRKIGDYPAHFGQASSYPLGLLLRTPSVASGGAASRLPVKFILRLQFDMAAHDLRHGKALQATARFLQTPVLVAVGALQQWAHSRLLALTLSTPVPKGRSKQGRSRTGPPRAVVQRQTKPIPLAVRFAHFLTRTVCALGFMGIPACDATWPHVSEDAHFFTIIEPQSVPHWH